MLSCCFLFSTEGFILLSIILVSIFILAISLWYKRDNNIPFNYLKLISISLLTTIIILFPFCIWNLKNGVPKFSFDSISFFHLSALSSALILTVLILYQQIKNKKLKLMLAIGPLILLFLVISSISSIKDSISYLTNQDPYVRGIPENFSVFCDFTWQNISLRNPIELFTFLFYLVPFSFFILLKKSIRGNNTKSISILILLSYTFVSFTFSVFQKRFSHLYASSVAICCAFFLFYIGNKISISFKRYISKKKSTYFYFSYLCPSGYSRC